VTGETYIEVVIPGLPQEDPVAAKPPLALEPLKEMDRAMTIDVFSFANIFLQNWEFLVEVNSLGGPMTPWCFYAVYNDSSEKLADYYKATQQL
jgi:hypothetical protein